MHRITIQKTGETLGYVEEPRYIYLAPSGSYVQCNKETAQGIAYKSTPYNLFDREPLSAKIDTVILTEIDSGELIECQAKKLDTLKTALNNSDDIIIQLYEHMLDQDKFNTNMDEAVLAIYENI